VKQLKIKNKVTNEVENLDVSGIFVAVGMSPNSGLVAGKVEMDDSGFIITDENMLTNKKLVYAVGDIRQKPLRQVITACADGATAAADAISRID
ncbi:MAG: FAD-dependent oxidoreductase, partial [Clostridia bacterium]